VKCAIAFGGALFDESFCLHSTLFGFTLEGVLGAEPPSLSLSLSHKHI
jgi:hypothetical protein